MVHVPGRLFSVNTSSAETIPRLFARNERVCCFFETPAGPMALILVGAIFVSSIETVWHGVVTPPTVSKVQTWHYPDQPPQLNLGDELGRFNMGSTIIVLFADNSIEWLPELIAGTTVKMGEVVGRYRQIAG
jgi:phosphatidylserine decarboxylase